MSKIDEVWKQIDILYATQEINQYLKVIKSLERLEPYVELAEYVMHNYVIDMRGEFIIEGQDEFLELINKIKEQGNGNN